ncbi:MAG: DUF6286 domain-containing protein [Nitriliruptoraceae bacterium]
MLLRALERLVALLFWVAVTVVAYLIAVQAMLDAMDRPEQVVDAGQLSRTVAAFDPTSIPAVAGAVGLVLLGLAVLLMEFTPRLPRSLIHRADERVIFTLDRRGLERRLVHAAEEDGDVHGATVRIRRRAKVTVQIVEHRDEASLRRRVRDRLREELGQLVVKRTPSVRVRVRSGGGRVS